MYIMANNNNNGLSLERLQSLLAQDLIDRTQHQEKVTEHHRRYQSLRNSIDEVWKSHYATSLRKPHLSSLSIPPTLYQSPLSEPQTTLRQWKSLPRSVQAKIKKQSQQQQQQQPDDDFVVEIPLAYLEAEAEDEEDVDSGGGGGGGHPAAPSMLQKQHRRRKLGGNLTNKLSEYTRGVAGQSRPFRPGGLGEEGEEEGEDDAVHHYDTDNDAVARSQRVLDCGKATRECWDDGSLMRAPPGVDFQVGLTWERVHNHGDDEAEFDSVGQDQQQSPHHSAFVSDDDDKDDDKLGQPSSGIGQGPPAPSSRTTTPALFSRAFFDDDSLFGSSSSSDDESDDDEEDEEGKDEDETADVPETNKGNVDPYSLVVGDDGASASATADDSITTDGDEVDALLSQLSATTDTGSLSNQQQKAAVISTNPLELAQKHSLDQKNSTRKVWATTKLLPIHDFDTLIPNPPLSFPFTLDDFQQQAVARLERSESVFVAAHTSAGKTVVAEYAVALAKQRATRCVYTSPIKALSNQKFRDFSLKFGSENVGLVTGDLQVNVDDSTCLIMTTEILRSMLYRGADLISDIEWVIFDEVHYVNDTERGVVWEEVIIMLPSYVNLIFLSATTPNTLEFSDWIGRTKRKPVHVVKTDYRPVPLSHFLWAGTKLHKIMEGKGGFLENGYKAATDALLPSSAKDPTKKKGDQNKGRPPPRPGAKDLAWQVQGSKQNWMSLVRFLDRELLTPTVVFSFSKRKCEEIANMLRSLDLNTAKEKSAVQSFSLQTVARLSENDAKLPQVLLICEMVQRGIGVHHGGLLPILKEMVEILFSRNLIKVLFATETFAMGVNMPARAVVYNSIRKHDGTQFRVLEPGEYTQMAGRAGRRGLDKVGTVIMCCFGETPPPQTILKQMLTGSSTRLQSQFRLTYNMILNLLRVEEMSVESMISRSFSEFATQRALTANDYPQLLSKGTRTLSKLEDKFKNEADSRVGAEDLEDYFHFCDELLQSNMEVVSYVRETEPAALSNILQPGRVLLVTAARQYGCVRAPAIVLRPPAVPSSSYGAMTKKKDASSSTKVVCMVLLPQSYVIQEKDKEANTKQKGSIGYVGSAMQRFYAICEVELDHILLISSSKHKIDAKSILKDDAGGGRAGHQQHGAFALAPPGRGQDNAFAGMKALGKKSGGDKQSLGSGTATKANEAVDKVLGYLLSAEKTELKESGLPVLDLRTFVKRGEDVVYFRKICDQVDNLVAGVRSFASHFHPNLEKHYLELERKEALREKVETLQHLLSNESLQLFPDFLQRKSVLQKLGYIDKHETVCVKGRVACECNTCESLIVTEMVFEGLLNDLEPEEIVAVLSALVFQEKRGEELDSELPEKLVTCCEQMKTVATNLGHLQKEQGLSIDPAEYCEGALKFGLVHVVYEWALGVPFKNICDLTDVQEGSIVRCITRLDELCREVRNCARVVGNPTLYRKLESASTSIKRDIVFASSLYVS